MDDYERTTQRVRTEETVPAVPAEVPVAGQPIYVAEPVVPAATPVVAARPAVSERVVTEHEVVHTGSTTLEMTRRIVGLAFGILQGLLIIRIVLLLLVANRGNGIVQFILGVTGAFVNPFRDMFALNQLGAQGSVLDIAAIVALIGWTLVELLIIAIVNLGTRRRTV